MNGYSTEKQLAYYESRKGKKYPKLSIALKGRNFSPATEFKKGLVPWNKGTKNAQIPWNKGMVKKDMPAAMYSKERNEKVRKGLLGNRYREDWPAWNKGLTKEQMPPSMFSVETQAKKSISCRLGNLKYIADNPNCYRQRKTWKGGISRLPYAFEFDKRCKDNIRKRDGYICQLCGMPEADEIRKLSIHHIDYNKLNCADSNLISLCRVCNAKVNFNRDFWCDYFQKIMNNKQQNMAVA